MPPAARDLSTPLLRSGSSRSHCRPRPALLTPTAPRRSKSAGAAAGALFLAAALGCIAPRSRPAQGSIAEQVEAAIDHGTERFDHARWNRLLAAGTRDGLVDYGTFTASRGELDAYLQSVAAVDLGSLTGLHLEALLINAYNAYTILSILEHPGIASIKEIDGVWSSVTHLVGGYELTLDQIEHNLLRPFFEDPRIHVAVNCASRSCAPLPPWAFDGDRLDEQLEELTRAFFHDRRYLRVEGGRLLVSKLLDWYGGDFTAPGWSPRADTLPEFIARYADEEVRRFIADHAGNPDLYFLDYDWSLNHAP